MALVSLQLHIGGITEEGTTECHVGVVSVGIGEVALDDVVCNNVGEEGRVGSDVRRRAID